MKRGDHAECRLDTANRTEIAALNPLFDERLRRQWAAAEALAYGWGGETAVKEATGMSFDTIRKGMEELSQREVDPDAPLAERVCSEGGGRRRLDEQDAELVPALERLVDPATRGDPESPLLKRQSYSLQGNRKTREGAQRGKLGCRLALSLRSPIFLARAG